MQKEKNKLAEYSTEELNGLYELGRLYFEMGYYAPAERIFNGLVLVDDELTPSRLALGILKLECGLYQEATSHFRVLVEKGQYPLQTKLGLSGVFIATGDLARARQTLDEVGLEMQRIDVDSEVEGLYEAFRLQVG